MIDAAKPVGKLAKILVVILVPLDIHVVSAVLLTVIEYVVLAVKPANTGLDWYVVPSILYA